MLLIFFACTEMLSVMESGSILGGIDENSLLYMNGGRPATYSHFKIRWVSCRPSVSVESKPKDSR